MFKSLKENNEKKLINPIIIDKNFCDNVDESMGRAETKLVNPVVIDVKFRDGVNKSSEKVEPKTLTPIKNDKKSNNSVSETIKKSETKLINPITIDVDYLAPKESKAPKKENIKLPASIVIDRNIIHKPSQNITEIENTTEALLMQGVSKAVHDYLSKEGLNYDSLKLLNPQLANSIGGAKCLLSVLPNIAYDAKEKRIYMWNNQIWEYIPESQLRKMCVKLLERQYDIASLCGMLDKNMINNGKNPEFEGIISMIKNISDLPSTSFNSAERVLCLKNGVFSFDDLMLHPFEEYKHCYITKQIDCNYYPNDRLDVVENFLFSIMGDFENVRFLQQIFGYAIIGNPTQQKAFILEGSGSNGKSTLLGALHNLLGDFIASVPVSYFTGDTKDDPNRPSPATYSVKDKLIVYTSEAQCSSYLNESRVKKFIGGGKLTARQPYGQLIEFDNVATLFFDTNHLPHFKSGGFSMERRLIVVPFPYTFTKDKIDLYLLDKLKTPHAKQALLSWLINGAIDYLRCGEFTIPQRVREATKAFFREEDTIGQFLDECTECDINSSVPFHMLYEAYKNFCTRNCLEVKSADTFSKSKQMQDFPVVRGKTRCRKGLRLVGTGM